jgi:hypothetical protein
VRHLSGFIPRDYLVSRADYLRAGGFNSSLCLYEDWELKIRLCQTCNWAFTGVVGTAYRANPFGLSHAPRKEHIKAMRHIFASHCPDRTPVVRALAMLRFFMYQSLYLRRPAL